jgi:alpha-ribazole phosphatase CobZ
MKKVKGEIMNTPIEGVNYKIDKNTLVISSDAPLKAISSAVYNGGTRKANTIINHQVSEDYDHLDPQGLLRVITEKLGFKPEYTIGLMTAAPVHNASVKTLRCGEQMVAVLATAGTSNAETAGNKISNLKKHVNIGTINIVLIIDGYLEESCMVNSLITATEAKTAALNELDIRSSSYDKQATGTTSDAIVVAATMRGEPVSYAGTATTLGEAIGICVKEAIKESLEKDNIIPHRTLENRLLERKITPQELVNTALEMFIPHPGIEDERSAANMLMEGLNEAFTDVNVSSFIMAGLRLEEDGQNGLIPNLQKKAFEKDPVFLLADEMLGMALANYVAGTKGLVEYIRFDRAKPGITKDLGPFLDDVICALVASVSSNMYTRAACKEKQ